MSKSAPDYMMFRSGREAQMRRAVNSMGSFLQGLVYSLNGSGAWQLGETYYRSFFGTDIKGAKDVWFSGYDGSNRVGLLRPHVTYAYASGSTSLTASTEVTVFDTSKETNSISISPRAGTMLEIFVWMGDISRSGDCQVEYKVKDGSSIFYQHDILYNKTNKPAFFRCYYEVTADKTDWLPTITAKRTTGTSMSQTPVRTIITNLGTDDFYNG